MIYRHKNLTALASTLAVLLFGAAASAQDSPDFEAWQHSFHRARQALRERQEGLKGSDIVALNNELMDRLDIETLRPSQAAWLAGTNLVDYTMFGEGGRDYTDRVLSIAHRNAHDMGAEGAAAHALIARLTMHSTKSAEENTALLVAALDHPGVDEAIRRGNLAILNDLIVFGTSASVRKSAAHSITGYTEKLPQGAPRMASGTDDLYVIVSSMKTLSDERLEEVRLGLVTLAKRAAEEARASAEPADANWYESIVEALELAPGVARLVGNAAPEIDFLWASGENPLKRLSDLRGKVVVLDFWATWCGPCLMTFPEVRELAERYKGHAVEIIGVTSMQGRTIFPDPRGSVLAENEAHEFEQMSEYMGMQRITWTVAFSRQDVFNPDYGVRGIPHMVIIDPAGVVRHRALHPGGPIRDKAAKIDSILSEFNLAAPVTLPELPHEDHTESDSPLNP